MSHVHFYFVRERLKAISKAPWQLGDGYEQADPGLYVESAEGLIVIADADGTLRPEDAAFIVNAPTDIASLLAEVERLTSELTTLRNKEALRVAPMVARFQSDDGETENERLRRRVAELEAKDAIHDANLDDRRNKFGHAVDLFEEKRDALERAKPVIAAARALLAGMLDDEGGPGEPGMPCHALYLALAVFDGQAPR